MPDSGRTDEIGIFSKRGQSEFRLFMRNEAAAPGDLFANAVQKKRSTPHQTAAQNNPVRNKEVDQVCDAEAEIIGLAINGSASQFVSFKSKLADLLGRAIGVTRRRLLVSPGCHGRSAGQRFPTTSKPTGACRS